MKRRLFLSLWLVMALVLGAAADDGMWLPHQMKMLNLKTQGLLMDPARLYQEDGTGLMSAVVHLGGGTGEFVSQDGLILTNHHVAFGAIQRASDKEHDYLANGFVARTRTEEISAQGYTANVLTGYKDVTGLVLAKVKPGMDLKKREDRINEAIEKLREAETAKGPDLQVRVSAMYGGNRYYMFVFKRLQDVRLVYAPPQALGNFGGEVDNWMWPRHTCDFSFLRAYVSPSGEGAPYSEENVPYHPKSVAKLSIDGLKEGDLTFVMGYPGRTYRNYMLKEVEAEITRMERSIAQRIGTVDFLERAGANDRGVEIKYASLVKGLNNYLKNYKGKLEGFKKADILAIKAGWEKEITDWVNADAARQTQYGDVVAHFNAVFNKQAAFLAQGSNRPNLNFASTLLGEAGRLHQAVIERAKSDAKRQNAYKDANWPRFLQGLGRIERSYDFNTDREQLKWTMKQWSELPLDRLPQAMREAVEAGPEAIDAFVDGLWAKTVLGDVEKRRAVADMTPQALAGLGDPLMELAAEQAKINEKARKEDAKRQKQAQELQRELDAAKRQVLAALLEKNEGRFAPDANSTIRFTYGNVAGYHPRDAVTYKAFTTLKGVLDKETGEEPFIVPEKIKRLYAARDFGRYEDPAADDIVTCFLNTTNVTGGSSGSPTFNAKGEQVGIIFDMTYESVIGDYYVIPEFQRTISVDIRYVLWVTEKFSGATHLIQEMGI